MKKTTKKADSKELQNGLKESNIVQKSKPLFGLWRSDLTLGEFKILDTYLSRIDSRNPKKRTVVIDKGKLEELLGVEKINGSDLKTRLRHLMNATILVDDAGTKIDCITLFERATAVQGEYGEWKIVLTCTPTAMKYIFNVEEIGYLRYKLRSVIQLTSLYSYLIFNYIEYNRFRKAWEVSVDELKSVLNCNEESYKEFKIFNNRILKQAQKELVSKTDLRYTYTPIRTGRRVTKIKFEVETLSDKLINKKNSCEEGQIYLADVSEHDKAKAEYQGELTELLGSAACDDEFSPEQIRVLQDLVVRIKPNADSKERCDYLKLKVDMMNVYDQKKKIKNRFNYLRKSLEKELS